MVPFVKGAARFHLKSQISNPKFQIGNVKSQNGDLKSGLANQEMQSGFTQANPIATVQGARLSGLQANDIIDYRAVD